MNAKTIAITTAAVAISAATIGGLYHTTHSVAERQRREIASTSYQRNVEFNQMMDDQLIFQNWLNTNAWKVANGLPTTTEEIEFCDNVEAASFFGFNASYLVQFDETGESQQAYAKCERKWEMGL